MYNSYKMRFEEFIEGRIDDIHNQLADYNGEQHTKNIAIQDK